MSVRRIAAAVVGAIFAGGLAAGGSAAPQAFVVSEAQFNRQHTETLGTDVGPGDISC